MKAQLKTLEDTLPVVVQTKQSLYDSYANMLLGYLLEVVKARSVAEQYLLEIFSELEFADIQAISRPGVNTFCQLQRIARKKLEHFIASVAACAPTTAATKDTALSRNKFIDKMAPVQQHVFCGLHYYGKSTAMLASELNQPEEVIRRILKESFTIIRNQRNDTAAIHR